MAEQDIVRVLRVIEYVGPRDWVERTLEKSIHGTLRISEVTTISAVTVGEFAELLSKVDIKMCGETFTDGYGFIDVCVKPSGHNSPHASTRPGFRDS